MCNGNAYFGETQESSTILDAGFLTDKGMLLLSCQQSKKSSWESAKKSAPVGTLENHIEDAEALRRNTKS